MLISPAFLLAGEVGVVLENERGESSYTVQSNNLKSKLDFPFEFNTLGIVYKTDILGFDIAFMSNFLINSETKVGKDYDWNRESLTVFSSSNNEVDDFKSYSLIAKKEIFSQINLVNKFYYKELDMSWNNTTQENFVMNKVSTIKNESLKYEQNFYQYNLGVNYEIDFDYDMKLNLEPSLIYSYIEAKDSHLLRNFYTRQDSNAFGYGLKIDFSKKITKNSILSLYYNYETYKDDKTNMDYYNISGNKYLSLSSSYDYENSVLGFGYSYLF